MTNKTNLPLATPLTPGVIPQLLPKATDEPREACSDIRCDYDASCELGKDGFPRCSCLFNCLHEPVNHVCGSDLRIYSSMCAMKMEACQRQQELRLRPLDLCQGLLVVEVVSVSKVLAVKLSYYIYSSY